MPPSVEPLFVGMLPRAPFLAHSDELLRHLLSYGPSHCHHALEIGCGPNSPLLPMLRRRWPEMDVHQIDARPDVVAAAARNHPGVRVEQMLASDMAAIPDCSKQLVVAMSVFDQNADDMLPDIAREVHRVLAPDGLVVYLHNEELNLPSAAASLLNRSAGKTLLLPSDRWRPVNDLEYCSADRSELEQALMQLRQEAQPLAQYLFDVYPRLYGTPPARSAYWKVAAPAMRDYTFPVMSQIRRCVAALRERRSVRLDDHRTTQLLRRHVEDGIFCEKHGFRIVRAGCFELRYNSAWNAYFKDRPSATYFVRGTMRFGYATASAPPPIAEYEQSLNRNPALKNEEVMLIAYQYGLVARKI
jgi:SAM-dependent methyltransferase